MNQRLFFPPQEAWIKEETHIHTTDTHIHTHTHTIRSTMENEGKHAYKFNLYICI